MKQALDKTDKGIETRRRDFHIDIAIGTDTNIIIRYKYTYYAHTHTYTSTHTHTYPPHTHILTTPPHTHKSKTLGKTFMFVSMSYVDISIHIYTNIYVPN